MSELANSQTSFRKALIEAAEPAPPDITRPAGFAAEDGQLKRFNVYRNNVVTTVIDALGDTFPIVRDLVGDAFFSATARAYFDRNPPTSPLLFRYGDTFGDFLDAFPPVQKSVPYLGDVARLEFARLQAYHAADCNPLEIEKLADISSDVVAAVRFDIHPSVTLVRSSFPVFSLWAASNGDLDPGEVDLKTGQDVLVVRPHFDIETILLPDGAGSFLSALLNGETLGGAAEKCTRQMAEFDLSMHLGGLFSAGVFIKILQDFEELTSSDTKEP